MFQHGVTPPLFVGSIPTAASNKINNLAAAEQPPL
jgi:hypothetical protein